jgi:phospholipase C
MSPARSGALAASLALALAFGPARAAPPPDTQLQLARAHIQHVIIVMQENRSFDEYFGTFPGAEGPPAGTCIPNTPAEPIKGGCTKPFHNPATVNAGGPHDETAYANDYRFGHMDGFILSQQNGASKCANPDEPTCVSVTHGVAIKDVMGYHNASEIPNYWTYAQTFVLQDHLFESVANWSYPSHLAMVSGWYASCSGAAPLTCAPTRDIKATARDFAWTYLPWLLDRSAVSWRYYLGEGLEPDCESGEMTCDPVVQSTRVPGIWNPIPAFTLFQRSVTASRAYASHVTAFDSFLKDVNAGALASVSWIVPGEKISEHPPSSVKAGMNYVTTIINAIASSSVYKSNTVIFLSWDDWGGFYDHVPPPVSHRDAALKLPVYGWGFRVPGLVISAWAKASFVDHQYLSFDNYNRFVEDLFLGGARLDPATDGRPDNRPVVAEAVQTVNDPISGAPIPVGDLLNDFDFTSPARTLPVLRLVK